MPKIIAPLSIPKNKRREYLKNYRLATQKTGNLFLFAGDQKVEHLNQDFFGEGISREDQNPEHLFKIAAKAEVGVFATQLGLIAQYGKDYKKIPYLVKINSKTNLTPGNNPISKSWVSVKDVLAFKKQSKLKIVGIGYTVYIGSEHEAEILQEASQAILEAQKAGLITVIWMYPRGEKIKNEDDIHLIAGGAGVASCLGADFVKLKYPYTGKDKTAKDFKEVVNAAGKTKVICAGGSKISPKMLLKNIYQQINIAGTSGVAIGRNIHQYDLKPALKLAKAIKAIVLDKKSLEKAQKLL